MLDKQREVVSKIVSDFLKNNLPIALFFIGIALVFISATIGDSIDELLTKGFADAILKSGSAILGAGVFAAIMKSVQFTEIFKSNIYDVFYNPEKIHGIDNVKARWITLTDSLLKNVLPVAHSDAAEHIKEQFFNSELEYHYENYTVTYDISIDSENNITTTSHIDTTIILSPNKDNPTLKQEFNSTGTSKLVGVLINGKQIDNDGLFTQDEKDKNINILKIPLKKYATMETAKSDKSLKFERTVELKQCMEDDPYMAATIKRYTKCFTIKAKVTDGYKLMFQKFGLGSLPKNHYIEEDINGYQRWQLAEQNSQLLPGQGYMIVVAKNNIEKGCEV